jgi:glycosyltransferase involved in cell wall biosynthesis
MRIAYITAGAAGMYCGSCLHDNALAAALIRAKQDVALIPIYTPIRTDESDVSIDHVFYGAVNVYLEQKSALFRHTPWLVDRMLNSRGLLDWASRQSGSVDARQLGELTLSMLEGEDGRQSKELEKLIAWLRDEFRPDVVNLPNSMLLGMAHGIREQLDVPVLCTLQGEDIFLEDLDQPYRDRVHELLRRKARDATGFIVNSRYYVDFMSGYLDVPASSMNVVHLGLNLDGHGVVPPASDGHPFTIGYLARVCPEKGLHVLVEAFRHLADGVGKDRVRLRIAGYLGQRDHDYKQGILEQIRSWGLADVVDYVGEVDREQKIDFLRSLHLLSVPTTYHEPKGLYVLEALANGVPVVQPRHGAFPEVLEATGGGLLVEPGDTVGLAAAFRSLMDEPARREELGRKGREIVHREYHDRQTAEKILKVYHKYVDNRTS